MNIINFIQNLYDKYYIFFWILFIIIYMYAHLCNKKRNIRNMIKKFNTKFNTNVIMITTERHFWNENIFIINDDNNTIQSFYKRFNINDPIDIILDINKNDVSFDINKKCNEIFDIFKQHNGIITTHIINDNTILGFKLCSISRTTGTLIENIITSDNRLEFIKFLQNEKSPLLKYQNILSANDLKFELSVKFLENNGYVFIPLNYDITSLYVESCIGLIRFYNLKKETFLDDLYQSLQLYFFAIMPIFIMYMSTIYFYNNNLSYISIFLLNFIIFVIYFLIVGLVVSAYKQIKLKLKQESKLKKYIKPLSKNEKIILITNNSSYKMPNFNIQNKEKFKDFYLKHNLSSQKLTIIIDIENSYELINQNIINIYEILKSHQKIINICIKNDNTALGFLLCLVANSVKITNVNHIFADESFSHLIDNNNNTNTNYNGTNTNYNENNNGNNDENDEDNDYDGQNNPNNDFQKILENDMRPLYDKMQELFSIEYLKFKIMNTFMRNYNYDCSFNVIEFDNPIFDGLF